MTRFKEEGPIYDEKVNRVLEGLIEGKKREELAEELGYSTYKSLDTYLRRRNFCWDSSRGTYVPKNPTPYHHLDIPADSNKVAMAIDLFQNSIDPREVAKKVGLKDHKDLAAFMRQQGYIWSVELANYIYDPTVETQREDEEVVENTDRGYREENINAEVGEEKALIHIEEEVDEKRVMLTDYLPLISYLHENRERIEELLDEENKEKQLPRYIIKGDTKNKNIHMNRLLARLLERYSKKHNISQRDIVEAALVEYFRRYGYQEVDDIINS